MICRSFVRFSSRFIRTMVDARLEAVPTVDIDAAGRFKYILIKVYGHQQPDGSEPNKLIVRGYQRAEWHGKFLLDVSMGTPLSIDFHCS